MANSTQFLLVNPIPVVSFDKISLFSIACSLLFSIAFHIGRWAMAPITGVVFLPLPVIGFPAIIVGGILDMPSPNGLTGPLPLAVGVRTGFLSSVILGAGRKPLAAIETLLLTFHEGFLLHESLWRD